MTADMALGSTFRDLVPSPLVRCLPPGRRRKYIRASVERGRLARVPNLVGPSDPFPTGTLFSTIGLLMTSGDDHLIPQLAPMAADADPFERRIFEGLRRHGEAEAEAAQDLLLAAGNDPAFDPYLRMCARAWALFLRLPRLAPAETAPGPAIFQYWDTPEVPDDVADAMLGWRALAGDAYQLMDVEGARSFLRAEYGATELRAFDACLHPAIQSDLIRMAWLARHGGLYMDADATIRPGFPALWSAMSDRTAVWFYSHAAKGHFPNGVISAPADSPLMRACLAETCRRILDDPQGHVYALGGPGMLTDMLLAADVAGTLGDVAVMTTDQVRTQVMTQIDAAYKSDARSWHIWQKSKPWEQGP
ncbi:MAG: glycosyltransferase family 32 protein [Paracoccaceae bacterium]